MASSREEPPDSNSKDTEASCRRRKLCKGLRAAIRRDKREALISSLIHLVELVSIAPEVHRRDFLDEQDHRGWTVLHLACLKNREDVVRLLLAPSLPAYVHGPELSCSQDVLARHWQPAKVNALTVERSTPLVVAAYNGRTEIAQLLLEHGADPSLTDHEGKTARDIAVARKNMPVVDVIDRWTTNSAKRAQPSTTSGDEEGDEQRATKLPRITDRQEHSAPEPSI